MKKKYYIDQKLFDNITQPEVAYLLGFLWADGHVRKVSKNTYFISIKAVKEDINEIEFAFRFTGNWSKKLITDPYRRDRLFRSLTDMIFGQFLASHDYLTKSFSSADKILSKIPENIRHYWWRGYFDGDGSVSFLNNKYLSVSFCGSYSQNYKFVEDLLNNLGIRYKISRKKTNSGSNSIVKFAHRTACKKFYNYIYQGKQFGLTRKQQKFLNGFSPDLNKQNRFITFKGETKALYEWAQHTNINRKTISDRIDKYGWSVEKALTTKP